jgi:hypothetical protein
MIDWYAVKVHVACFGFMLASVVGLTAWVESLPSSEAQTTPTYRQQQAHPQASTFDVVEARKFVLRDDSGLVRLEIGPKGQSVGIRLLDRKGRERLTLAVADAGEDVGLALTAPDGTARVVLSVQPDGQMVLVSGDRKAGIYALNQGHTAFVVDGADAPEAMIGVDARGEPVLEP